MNESKKVVGRWRELAEAFYLFSNFSNGSDYWDPIQSDDGGLWGGPDPSLMSAGERSRLVELGWVMCETYWTYSF